MKRKRSKLMTWLREQLGILDDIAQAKLAGEELATALQGRLEEVHSRLDRQAEAVAAVQSFARDVQADLDAWLRQLTPAEKRTLAEALRKRRARDEGRVDPKIAADLELAAKP